MHSNPAPKVFLSHASEDKDRFVLKFAEALRTGGIDVWLDKWEMLPGDSLIDKIFEEGIKNASALIVVLSGNSVKKPWVREELNAGFVKRVAAKCRIIPVVLDDCDVPECLKSTVWVKIPKLDDYPDQLKRVVNAVFGLTDKPPIGAAPVHAHATPAISIPSLHKVDLLVLEALCEQSVKEESRFVNDLSCLDPICAAGVSDGELRDSLGVLEAEYYIKPLKVLGPTYRSLRMVGVEIYERAFEAFARIKWPDYEDIRTRLVSGIVNEGWNSKPDLDKLGVPQRLADHLVQMVEDEGGIKVSRHFGGYSIWEVSPKLKRSLA